VLFLYVHQGKALKNNRTAVQPPPNAVRMNVRASGERGNKTMQLYDVLKPTQQTFMRHISTFILTFVEKRIQLKQNNLKYSCL